MFEFPRAAQLTTGATDQESQHLKWLDVWTSTWTSKAHQFQDSASLADQANDPTVTDVLNRPSPFFVTESISFTFGAQIPYCRPGNNRYIDIMSSKFVVKVLGFVLIHLMPVSH